MNERWDLPDFQLPTGIPAQPQGDDAGGTERRSRQESPGKSGTQRRDKVGDLQARDQDSIAEPRRTKERSPSLPPAENRSPQKPKVKTARNVYEEKQVKGLLKM
jgi:hypothetical protein